MGALPPLSPPLNTSVSIGPSDLGQVCIFLDYTIFGPQQCGRGGPGSSSAPCTPLTETSISPITGLFFIDKVHTWQAVTMVLVVD